MSVYIDRKFLLQVSPKLQRFSQKKTDLYNFRCPFCGDSQKNKAKARGFIFRKKNDYFYSCHNCGISHTFYNFLNFVEPNLIKEYSLDRYKDGESGSTYNYKQPKFEFSAPIFKESIKLDTIESLPDDHVAKQYVINRRIPKERWSELYFAPDFAKFVESYNIERELKSEDPRLIIPFYDQDKNLFAFQGRALTASKLKYITIKIDEDAKKLYGLDKTDISKRVYVVEGPIDSMFIDNCIATADATLSFASDVSDNLVLVNDNEPRNMEIIKQIALNIKKGFNVVIWPNNLTEKDINDMIMNGMNKEQIKNIIDEHTYNGLRAEFELNNWRKV